MARGAISSGEGQSNKKPSKLQLGQSISITLATLYTMTPDDTSKLFPRSLRRSLVKREGLEQLDSRSMNKLDLFLFSTGMLQLTLTLLRMAASLSSYVYNYWFHTSDNARTRSDMSAWTVHISFRFLCYCCTVSTFRSS